MDQDDQDDQDGYALRAFSSDVRTVCGAWASEHLVRKRYLMRCTGTDSSKARFCQCTWTEWRKRRPLALFTAYEPIRADEIEASDEVAKSCQGTYPSALARAEYLTGCAEGDSSKLESCLCLWERLRKKYSVEQLVLGEPRRQRHFGDRKPGPLEKDLEACTKPSRR